MTTLTARRVGGPTAVLEYAGLRWSPTPRSPRQGADALRAAFVGNGIADRLALVERGETVAV
jgi:hypothetical protein